MSIKNGRKIRHMDMPPTGVDFKATVPTRENAIEISMFPGEKPRTRTDTDRPDR